MLLRSTLVYGPAILLPRLAGFAIVLILTHRLAAAEFGLYALVIMAGEAIDMTASNWIRLSLLRLDIANPGGWRAGLLRSHVLFGFTAMAGIALTAIMAEILAAEQFWAFVIATGAYVIANGALRIGLTGLQMQHRDTTYTVIESVRAALQLGAVLLLSARSAVGSFLDYSLATACVSLCVSAAAVTLSWRGLPRQSGAGAGYAERLRYGGSLIFLALVTYVIVSADRFFLKLLAGPALVGLYAAAYVFGRQPVDVVSNAINQGAFPELMKQYDNGGEGAAGAFLSRTLDLFLLLNLSVVAFLYGSAPAIADALLPPAYRPTANILIPLIAAGAMLQAMKSFVFDNIFHMYRRNWLQLASYLPAGLVTVVLALILIPAYGAVGAGMAVVAGMASGLLASLLMTRRLLRVPLHGREIAKAILIALLAGLAGAFARHLTAAWPALTGLGAVMVMGGVAWLVGILLLRPAALAGALPKMFSR